jgi:hypothetical protein
MNGEYLSELRNIATAIRNIEESGDGERKEKGRALLQASFDTMISLGYVGRKEGLLALEEASHALKKDEHPEYKYLQQIMMLVVDGTDPDLVADISIARYYALDLKDYAALSYLMFMEGSLSIQAGENPRITEEKLLAFMPEDIGDVYREKREKEWEESYSPFSREPYKSDFSVVEKYYEGDVEVVYGEDAYFVVKFLDAVLKELNDRALQRLLRDVDNCDLQPVLRAVSGACRKHVFENMSEQRAIMTAEDMDWMWSVSVRKIRDASFKVLSSLIKLINCAEIMCEDDDVILAFGNLVGMLKEDEPKRAKVQEAESDLERVIDEYKKHSYRELPPFGKK